MGTPAIFTGHMALRTGTSESQIDRRDAVSHKRIQNSKGKGIHGNEKAREGKTDLHHGLLVLAVFHLRCGQVNDATLHWVFVAVIDEDIRATDHNKMLSPVAGKWLLEMQISFFGNH